MDLDTILQTARSRASTLHRKLGAYVAIVKESSGHTKHTGHYSNLPCYFHVNRSLDQVRYSSGGFSENKIHSFYSLQKITL